MTDNETGDESIRELVDSLEEIHEETDDHEIRDELEQTIEFARGLTMPTKLFGQIVNKYTSRDLGESFVGSVIFCLPLLVEDGVFDIADFLLNTTIWNLPVYLLGNLALVALLPLAILYWADFQQLLPQKKIFGLVPRRYVGILLISLGTTIMLMTLWGRLDGWHQPGVAMARISCVWLVAALGASLGDILPGQSSGRDISNALDDVL